MRHVHSRSTALPRASPRPRFSQGSDPERELIRRPQVSDWPPDHCPTARHRRLSSWSVLFLASISWRPPLNPARPDVDEEDARWKPAEDRFSVAEVLSHLSHSEWHRYRARMDRFLSEQMPEFES